MLRKIVAASARSTSLIFGRTSTNSPRPTSIIACARAVDLLLLRNSMTSATPTPAQKPQGKAPKPPKEPKPTHKPTPEEIEALRAARAKKREEEAQQKEEALAAERRAARERAATGAVPLEQGTGRPLYVGREWASVRGAQQVEADQVGVLGRKKVRVVSWNILAQGLIERRLFPGSDVLKWKQRSPGLSAELVGHVYDIGCFQEVDRFEVHSETLKLHGYAYEYERGYRKKKHGLAIVWRTVSRPGGSVIFDPKPAGRAVLYLDHASVSSEGPSSEGTSHRRTAVSRETRNIALFVAIRFAAPHTGGVIVATTHTFWHPKHSYERARQVAVLIRELDRFRRRPGAEWAGWDCILAGDFNDQPDSATYELATARPQLRNVAIEEVAGSMVVHNSVDEKINAPTNQRPTQGLHDIVAEGPFLDGLGVELTSEGVLTAAEKAKADETAKANSQEVAEEEGDKEGEEDAGGDEGEGEGEPKEKEPHGENEDRILKNCRPARASDGLLTLNELRQLYDLSQPAPSATGAYDPEQTPDPRSNFDNSVRTKNVIGVRSAYGTYYNKLNVADKADEEQPEDGLEAGNFFGSPTRGRERWNDPDWTKSEHIGDGYEPMWTIFSSLFSLTLDYIFLLPRIGDSGQADPDYPAVTALLRTHRTEVLQPGTPRRYVNASDHIAIGAEVILKRATSMSSIHTTPARMCEDTVHCIAFSGLVCDQRGCCTAAVGQRCAEDTMREKSGDGADGVRDPSFF
ncbi:hypothetical protein V8E36_004772 [Tilletia maclaganii]